MNLRAMGGELALCTVFIATGAFWVAGASGLQLWDGFAPATGFLPLVYGILLAVLGIAATAVDVLSADGDAEAKSPPGRPLMIILALAAGVAGIETAGFFASMFLSMLFLFRVAERLPLVTSVGVAAGSSLALTLVFRTWLGVPFPVGPWGF
jgi:hypothetical protein